MATGDGKAATAADGADSTSRSNELIQSVAREVEVTRRLYRSGESEYLIDGAAVPAARRPRSADGHGARRQGLRDHRAGQDRDDPQLAADRSAPADRRSGRRHEVQGAPARRRAQARGRAAEPDAHRRHRLRGREAARHAEAPGGEGAALPAAARRAAALGEGALRARSTAQLARDDRIGARAPGRGARARSRRRCPASPRSKPRSGRCASSWSRPTAVRRAPAKRAHARELAITPQRAAGRVRPRAGCAHSVRASSTSTASSRRSTARREPARVALDAPPRRRRGGRRRPRSRGVAPGGRARRRTTRRIGEIEGLEGRRRGGAQRSVLGDQARRRRSRHALEHASAARDRVGDALPSSTSKIATCGSSPSASARERAAADDARRAPRALERASPGARGARAAIATGTSTHAARSQVRARARTRARGLAARLTSLEELDACARRLRRRGPRGAGAGQRPGQPAGRGGRLPRGRTAATSAPSRPASATCSSTSSCERPGCTPRRLRTRCATQGAGRCGFLVAARPRWPTGQPERSGMPTASSRCRRSCAPTVRSRATIAAVLATPGSPTPSTRRAAGRATGARSPRSTATSSPAAALVVGGGRARCARHPRDQARDQGAARARRERRAEVAALIERLSAASAAVDVRDRTPSPRWTPSTTSRKRPSSASTRSCSGRPTRPIACDRRASSSRASGSRRPKRSAPARAPAGRGARVDRRARTSSRQADERLTAAQRRLFEARERAEELSRAGGRSPRGARGAGRARVRARDEVPRLEEAGAELEDALSARATETGQKTAERAALDVATSPRR